MNKKKLLGAIIPAVLTMIYLMFILGWFIYMGVADRDIPLPAFIIIIIGILIPLVGICIAMILRIKELKKGEAEEAEKY